MMTLGKKKGKKGFWPPDTTTLALVSSGRSLFVRLCSSHSETPEGSAALTAVNRWGDQNYICNDILAGTVSEFCGWMSKGLYHLLIQHFLPPLELLQRMFLWPWRLWLPHYISRCWQRFLLNKNITMHYINGKSSMSELNSYIQLRKYEVSLTSSCPVYRLFWQMSFIIYRTKKKNHFFIITQLTSINGSDKSVRGLDLNNIRNRSNI